MDFTLFLCPVSVLYYACNAACCVDSLEIQKLGRRAPNDVIEWNARQDFKKPSAIAAERDPEREENPEKGAPKGQK